jgi:tight adherence protein C
VAALGRRIEAAGRSRALTPEEVASAQVLCGAVGVGAAVLFVGVLGPTPSVAVGVLMLLPSAGVLAPRVWVERAAQERQAMLRRELPDVLDLLAISVEAGLGFEGALDMASRNFGGPLADELRRTLREMELGASRHQALTALKRRVDVRELSTFVTALVQADALGMPIGRVLHAQAAELRMRRRQWAREKAGKMPVKILFPLMGFIFPPVMVILLGPAAISILQALR